MSDTTQTHVIDVDIDLLDAEQHPIHARALEMSVDLRNGIIIRCYLSLRVGPAVYQQIDAKAIFHLRPEVRGQIFGGKLDSTNDVEIDLKLDPAFIFMLSLSAKSAQEVAEQLLQANQARVQSDLLPTENWYACYVKQQVELPPEIGPGSLKIGYSTTWANV